MLQQQRGGSDGVKLYHSLHLWSMRDLAGFFFSFVLFVIGSFLVGISDVGTRDWRHISGWSSKSLVLCDLAVL